MKKIFLIIFVSFLASFGLVDFHPVNDGIFDWVWLGDGFNQQNKYIFDQHCDHAEAFFKTLHPFDSLWTSGKLKFHRKLVTGNLNCKYFGFESIDCNWDKVVKAAFTDGIQPDFVHVFALGKGYGTGNGGIAVLGIGTGQPSSADLCDYWFKLVRLDGHEDGHAFGLAHALIPTCPANLMSQATNGGCFLGSTYLDFQQQTILNYIKSKIQ